MRFALVAGGAVVLILGGRLLLVLVTNPTPQSSAGWTLLAPLPHARGETAVAVAGDRIWVIGGLEGLTGNAAATVDIYDTRADSWVDGSDIPAPRHHAAAAAIGSAIYLAGGADGTWAPQADVWRWNPDSGAWAPVAPLPEPRYGHRLLAHGSKLYVVGGVGGTSATLAYDPAWDSWSPLAPLPVQIDHVAAAVVGDELWVIGGRSDSGIHAGVHIYDVAMDSWKAGPALPTGTSGAAEAAMTGLVLVSGGERVGATGEQVIDRHWWIDTESDDPAWLELPAPPLSVHGVPGAVVEDRFYIIGGATRPGTQSFWSWVDTTQGFDLRTLRR